MEIGEEDSNISAREDDIDGSYKGSFPSCGVGSKYVGKEMEANEPKEGDDDVTNEESTHHSNFVSPSQWVTALGKSDHILGPQGSPTQDASPLSRTVDPMNLFWPYRTQKSWFNLPKGNLSPNIELSKERVVKANIGQGDRPTHLIQQVKLKGRRTP